MKRSEINAIIRDADSFIKSHQFHLPPFAYWSPADWHTKGGEVAEIVQNGLGWDITDFGQGDYAHLGLTLFTIRNGSLAKLKTMQGKIYAEKLLIVDVDQVTPFHYHAQKTEDIINRGGGLLRIQLANSTPDDQLADTEVMVSMDGIAYRFPAHHIVTLRPGESITLQTSLYHKFWGEGGRVLVGEVSMVNDDHADNKFLEPLGRFPAIEEDEPPLYLLVGDYPKYYTGR